MWEILKKSYRVAVSFIYFISALSVFFRSIYQNLMLNDDNGKSEIALIMGSIELLS